MPKNDNQIVFYNLLVKLNADLNQFDGFGKTPLHLAIEKKDLNMIKSFLKPGVNINLIDIKGKTAYDLAVELNEPLIMLILENFIKNNTVIDPYKEKQIGSSLANSSSNSKKNTPLLLFTSNQQNKKIDLQWNSNQDPSKKLGGF